VTQLAVDIHRLLGEVRSLQLEVQQLHTDLADLRSLVHAECKTRREIDEHIWDRLNGEHSVKA